MRRTATSFAVALFAAISIGTAAAPASAQETNYHRKLDRQQQVIQEQQRQIREYQRQLAARQQPAAQEDAGLLSGLGCPRGYTYSWLGQGCYPNLPAQVIVTPAQR